MGAFQANRRTGRRFVLRAGDTRSGRYARKPFWGKREIYRIEVQDLSHSGLAFIVDRELAPHVGERISLEFQLPQAEKMAWWGEVVRTQKVEGDALMEDTHWEYPVKVGIRFHNLPVKVQQHIDKRLDHAREHEVRDVIPLKEESIHIEIQTGVPTWALWLARIGLGISILAAAYGFYHFSQQIVGLTYIKDAPKFMNWNE